MNTSKITQLNKCGEWTGKHGTMYEQKVELEDGVILVANSKTETPIYKVGDLVEYEVTGEYKGTKKGKVRIPQEGPVRSSYGKTPEEAALIARQSMVKAACTLYAQTNTDPVKVTATAEAFFNYVMTGQVTAKLEEKENNEDLPF